MKSFRKRSTKRRRGSRSHAALGSETQRYRDVEGLYWRMKFYWLPDCLKVRMGGRFVRDFAEHARTLIRDSTLPSKVIVDLSEVNHVDPVGEEVLLWFRDMGVSLSLDQLTRTMSVNACGYPPRANRRRFLNRVGMDRQVCPDPASSHLTSYFKEERSYEARTKKFYKETPRFERSCGATH